MEPNLAQEEELLQEGGMSADAIQFEQDVYDEDIYDDEEDFYEDSEEDESYAPVSYDASRIDVESIIALTARLSQVLAEEADFLSEMKTDKIEQLQKEKIHLLEALEAQKKFIDRNPELLDELTDDECLELAQIIEIFQTVMRENHRRLLIAKEVNRTVVRAISDAASDAAKNGLYDRKGLPEKGEESISMSVNQTI